MVSSSAFFKKCLTLEAETWKAASLEEFPNITDFELHYAYCNTPEMWKKGFLDRMSRVQSRTVTLPETMLETGTLPFEMEEGNEWCLMFSADRNADHQALSVFVRLKNPSFESITRRVEVTVLNSKRPAFSRKQVLCSTYTQLRYGWGWSKFLPLKYLENAAYGFLSEEGKIQFRVKMQWGWMEAGREAGMEENLVHTPQEAYVWYQLHLCSFPESEDGWMWESTNCSHPAGELVLVTPAEKKWLDYWEQHARCPADQKKHSRCRLLKVLRKNKGDFARSEKYLKEGRHIGITCDVCGHLDFQGIRVKCQICQNYDLCGNCYQSEKCSLQHTTEHSTIQVNPYLQIET